MEHPEFEGHVTLNEGEYQKSVQLKFRYCLGVSQFTISRLITSILAEETAFEISHFRIFQTSMTLTLTLTLDRVIGLRHTSGITHRRPLAYQIYSNWKNVFVDGRTDTETSFIGLILRNRPNKISAKNNFIKTLTVASKMAVIYTPCLKKVAHYI